MKVKQTKKENAQVELEVVLPVADVEKYRDHVEKEFFDSLELPGFRKGHVPRDVAQKHMNSLLIFEDMTQHAISDNYGAILEEAKVRAIGHPQILITKLAEGSDVEFKITTAVAPEVTLGDYKKIAKTENEKTYSVEVEDNEVDEAIYNLRKMSAQQKNQEKGGEFISWGDIKDEELPPLDDDWAKTLGAFENLTDLRTKITENIQKEKEAKNLEKRRMTIIQTLIADSNIEVPDILVNYEIDKMMHEFEHNIAMTGMGFDEYLDSIKKTRDDYRTEWRPQALERAQTELLLNEIARAENINPDEETVEKETKQIMEQYKNQAGIQEANVRAYVANVLTHQKVFEFLDNQ